MLYPSVQQMTNERVNRYALVVATAKGARYVNEKFEKQRQELELQHDDQSKDSKSFNLESLDEKAVSIAISKIQNNEFKIILPGEDKTNIE